MGAGGPKEKVEEEMMIIKLERMEVQMEKEKNLKQLAQIEGRPVPAHRVPDYIDPKFAKEHKIYDEDDGKGGAKGKGKSVGKKPAKEAASAKSKKSKSSKKSKGKKKGKSQNKNNFKMIAEYLMNKSADFF